MSGLPEFGSPSSGEPGLRNWTTTIIGKIKTWSNDLGAGTILFKDSTRFLNIKNIQDAIESLGTYTDAATAPSSPVAGDRWFDTDTGILYTYRDDGGWVEL